MAEAASFGAVATVVTAVAAGTGAVAVPALAAFGIDGYSVGAGLLGCVVVQVFCPPERVTVLKIAATVVGSMVVATLGAPYIAPLLKVGSVTAEHANALASALLGGSAKPVILMVKARFESFFANWLPPQSSGSVPSAKKGPDDA